MTDKALKVRDFLVSGALITTRLREQSRGERHDLTVAASAFDRLRLGPEEIITALHELEESGVVRRAEAVNVYDSSEYSIVWSLV